MHSLSAPWTWQITNSRLTPLPAHQDRSTDGHGVVGTGLELVGGIVNHVGNLAEAADSAEEVHGLPDERLE